MRRFDVSLRWKMTLLSTGLLAVLIVSFGLFLYFEVERLMISSLDTSFTLRFEQALRAAPRLTEELAAQQLGGRPERLPTLESVSGSGVFLQISDRNGRVVAASSNLGRTRLPAPKIPSSRPGQVQQEVIRLPVAGLVPEAANTDLKEARFLLRSSLLVDGNGHAVGLLSGVPPGADKPAH